MGWFDFGMTRRPTIRMGCLVVALASGPAGAVAMSLDPAGCAVPASAEHQRALYEVANRPSQRIVAIKRDAIRSSTWAVVVDCEHPDWPARMVLMTKKAGGNEPVEFAALIPSVRVAAQVLTAVRAGSTVRVWKHDGVTSLETTGVADESGEIGKRIRVRLLRLGMNSADAASYVAGVVRGVGDVEIVQ